MATNTESSAVSDARYKFKSLNVYSSDEWMYNTTRKYRQVFDIAETTFISAEFSFFNKYFDEKEWEAKICLKAYFDNGKEKTELCKLENTRVIKTDENVVIHSDGWGKPQPGAYWTKGNYFWEAYIDNVLVGSKYFYIENVGLVTPGNNPYFTVESLKLFAANLDPVPANQRRYLKKFKRDETRYVWVEFKYRNNTASDYYCEIQVNIYDEAGQPKSKVVSVAYMAPGTQGQVYEVCEGWGSNVPGGWKDDKYTVEIVFMDVLVAAVPFEVGDEEVAGEPQLMTGPVIGFVDKQSPDEQKGTETIEQLLDELDHLVGIAGIKKEVHDLIKLVNYYRETGKDVQKKFSLHSVFTGNPGTGKTTVARIMGKIYRVLGFLEKGHIVECAREQLVAGYIGQTAIKTGEMIDKARGGVLFIDEAYALAEGSENDFGKEAIEVLLKDMEDMRGDLAVIVAGYTDKMRIFLESNPGLKSRFDKLFHFDDFSSDELYEIATGLLTAEDLKPDNDAASKLKSYFIALVENKDAYFGNARDVRTLMEAAIRNQQLRMADIEQSLRTKEMIETLTYDDIKDLISGIEQRGSSSIGFKLGDRV